VPRQKREVSRARARVPSSQKQAQDSSVSGVSHVCISSVEEEVNLVKAVRVWEGLGKEEAMERIDSMTRFSSSFVVVVVVVVVVVMGGVIGGGGVRGVILLGGARASVLVIHGAAATYK